MADLYEFRIKDFIRGNGNQEVLLRFDRGDTVEVECFCDYGISRGDEKRYVKIPRKIEIYENGEWRSYPVACWIDQDDNPDGIFSRAVVFKKDGFYVMQSPMGVPDSVLLVAAEEAGIFTQTINI